MASPFPIFYPPSRTLRAIDPFLDLSREMNRLVDNFFPGAANFMGAGARAIDSLPLPRIDVQENATEICISAELPGVNAADVELRVDGDVITICGEKRTVNKEDIDNYRVLERSYGSFQRSVPLPFTPDPQQISAEFKLGVLTIRVPRQAERDPSQRIEVKDLDGDGERLSPQVADSGIQGQGGESTQGEQDGSPSQQTH